MGILDDAIRQHLDLKRRHGAREAELKQLEDEAFGPPSRPGEPDFPQPGEAGPRDETEEVSLGEAAAGTATEPEPAPPPELDAEADTESAEALAPEEVAEPASEPEAGAEEPEGLLYDHAQEQEEAFDLGDLELDEERAIDDQEAAAEEAAAPRDRREEPLIEEAAPVEEEWADETGEAVEDEDDEDVLEETPEFLRDAPEDEELWFEQGEPQDFDFEDEK
jgi:hypothetical protein